MPRAANKPNKAVALAEEELKTEEVLIKEKKPKATKKTAKPVEKPETESEAEEQKPESPKKQKKTKAKAEAEEKPKKEKRTRKPSAFNHYMSRRLAEMKADEDLKKDKTHKELFALAASEWSAMTKEEQDRIKAELSE